MSGRDGFDDMNVAPTEGPIFILKAPIHFDVRARISLQGLKETARGGGGRLRWLAGSSVISEQCMAEGSLTSLAIRRASGKQLGRRFKACASAQEERERGDVINVLKKTISFISGFKQMAFSWPCHSERLSSNK